MPPGTPFPPVCTEPVYGDVRHQRAVAERWLYQAAPNTAVAQQEWQEKGCALLDCGVTFDAVRVPFAVFDRIDRQRIRRAVTKD
jgi:hypothetical protein